MFSSVGLFKEVDCPESQQCLLPNCIFSHRIVHNDKKRQIVQAKLSVPLTDDAEAREDDTMHSTNGARKKRRIDRSSRDELVNAESKERARIGQCMDKLSVPLTDDAEAKEVDTMHLTNEAQKKRRVSSSDRDEVGREESDERVRNGQCIGKLSAPLADDAEGKDDDSMDSTSRARKKRRTSSPGRDELVRVESGEGARNGNLKTPDSIDGVRNGEGRGEAGRRKPPMKQLRDISPPPVRNSKARASDFAAVQKGRVKVQSTIPISSNSGTPPAKKTIVEPLNPRLLPDPPATHAIRLKLIIMLHEHITRLNEEIKRSDDRSKSTVELSAQGLVAAALSEEEKIAKQYRSVYSNMMKLRIVALKKMKVSDWIAERLKQIAVSKPGDVPSAQESPETIDTDLSPHEEIALLPRLLAKQETLINHGYIPVAPSEEDVEQAQKGVEAAQGWEQCDRCKTRFQVFPGRRAEDGALTTGGMCMYHSARPRRPTGETADRTHKEPFYACCNETVGKSTGCTSSDTHVFKISEAKRLALVMPFMETPPNLSIQSDNAVCFDCEMGYTTQGMELIRLTAVSWPDGSKLVDVLVRPLGEILDLNSRYSGVWPKDFASATPHSASAAITADHLQLVDSPSAARALLFSHLTPTTPLIGHALENDLNAIRIIHPCIIDSVVLYPHPRGLPLRLGLKTLLKKHLERDIQMGGALGHDSAEDARAAGELVRLKISEVWKEMKRAGWTVKAGKFSPPVAAEGREIHPSVAERCGIGFSKRVRR